jgi:formate-dependent nitrite reductase membrane component NrfD
VKPPAFPNPDPALGVAPRAPDGRNIDPETGLLLGEGAAQEVRDLRAHPAPPSAARADARDGQSYYGLPVLKEHRWRWEIPAYFFVGGLAGACAVLGAAAQLAGGRAARPLVRRCRLVATAGAAASAALLVKDLGRPARFLYMLRVFRPTSPMNMGTWVISAFGALSSVAALPAVVPVPRALRRASDVAGLGAGLVGLPLVGYTGVLLSNTAVPVWQGGRRSLPVLFAFSGAASAGALFEMWPPPEPGAEIARRLGLASTAAELLFSVALQVETAIVPRVAQPLRTGRSGFLYRGGQTLALAALVAGLSAPRSRGARRFLRRRATRKIHAWSGILGTLATLALRFGIVSAGRASARDPHATFEQQRQGHGAREVAREAVLRGTMPSLPGVDATGRESVERGASA